MISSIINILLKIDDGIKLYLNHYLLHMRRLQFLEHSTLVCSVRLKLISQDTLLKKYSLVTETTQSLSITKIATRVMSSLVATEFAELQLVAKLHQRPYWQQKRNVIEYIDRYLGHYADINSKARQRLIRTCGQPHNMFRSLLC